MPEENGFPGPTSIKPEPALPLSCILAASSSDVCSTDMLAGAAAAGFDAVAWHVDGDQWRGQGVVQLVAAGIAAGLRPLLALDLACSAFDEGTRAAHPALFAMRATGDDGPVDPRRPAPMGEPVARLASAGAIALASAAARALGDVAGRGVHGFVLTDGARIGSAFLERLGQHLRALAPDVVLFGSLGDGAALPSAPALDGWIVPSEAAMLARLSRLPGARLLAAPAGDMPPAMAALADGLYVPLARFRADPSKITAAIGLLRRAARYKGERRMLRAAPPVLLRADAPDLRSAREALMIATNTTDQPIVMTGEVPGLGFVAERSETVEPGGSAVLLLRRAKTVAGGAPIDPVAAAAWPRLAIEQVTPGVEGGSFAVKRIVGEAVEVKAAVFGDGHEQLAAELLWRAVDTDAWQAVAMEPLPNDGWRATFTPVRLGRHEFAVEGWLDRFGGFQRDFAKKLAAGVAQPVDLAEGRRLVEDAAGRTAALAPWPDRLAAADDGEEGAALLLSLELRAAMRAADDRPHALRSAPQLLDAERIEARFSSWYELFPRSITDDRTRHGTFADVVGELPRIRDMGFDTLYFPPIHPIGSANRKGPNNTLTPGPDDVGSPYAIGSADGGHEAIHPALGSFDDFAKLVAAAREHGLEIALDFAVQCSPDHPWLAEHPGWFAWRPDGSMKYAENPPKKYQDIVNVDFYGPDAVPGLWTALRDIVLLWVSHGVTVFRVDNPHTKPLPFWEWMIADVRGRHPEVIFLAEAFTRPNMMYRLAKIGFSQSYTYFTWRDTKRELIDYIVELTTTAPREFYRPHFFVNTPDINPIFLQTSGRSGFRIRAVLAATLSGLFGVYSGFELCEAAPVPGKEEYLDSEKYEIRPRDWQAPGNIIADITLLNRLRRENEALQTHLNTVFFVAGNDQVIYYGKPAADGSAIILVMVSLDPHGAQETAFEVPLWEFGLPDTGSVDVEDLAEGWRFRWQGKDQFIRLDPAQPFRIWRIRP